MFSSSSTMFTFQGQSSGSALTSSRSLQSFDSQSSLLRRTPVRPYIPEELELIMAEHRAMINSGYCYTGPGPTEQIFAKYREQELTKGRSYNTGSSRSMYSESYIKPSYANPPKYSWESEYEYSKRLLLRVMADTELSLAHTSRVKPPHIRPVEYPREIEYEYYPQLTRKTPITSTASATSLDKTASSFSVQSSNYDITEKLAKLKTDLTSTQEALRQLSSENQELRAQLKVSNQELVLLKATIDATPKAPQAVCNTTITNNVINLQVIQDAIKAEVEARINALMPTIKALIAASQNNNEDELVAERTPTNRAIKILFDFIVKTNADQNQFFAEKLAQQEQVDIQEIRSMLDQATAEHAASVADQMHLVSGGIPVSRSFQSLIDDDSSLDHSQLSGAVSTDSDIN